MNDEVIDVESQEVLKLKKHEKDYVSLIVIVTKFISLLFFINK